MWTRMILVTVPGVVFGDCCATTGAELRASMSAATASGLYIVFLVNGWFPKRLCLLHRFARCISFHERRGRVVEIPRRRASEVFLRLRGAPRPLERQPTVVPDVDIVGICMSQVCFRCRVLALEKIGHAEQLVGAFVLARILIRRHLGHHIECFLTRGVE